MCFSAQASFATAAVLTPIGGWCLAQTPRKGYKYLGFAIIPLAFGVQQFAEGMVWLGLRGQPGGSVQVATAIYLFFALAFWPTWFAIAAALAEEKPPLRTLLWAWAGFTSAWFWFAWLPVVVQPNHLLPEVCQNSVRYSCSDSGVLGLRGPMAALYVVCAGGPLVIMSRRQEARVPLFWGIAGLLAAGWLYDQTFTSVWCFFAALVSVHCAFFFARLPNLPESSPTSELAASATRPGVAERQSLTLAARFGGKLPADPSLRA